MDTTSGDVLPSASNSITYTSQVPIRKIPHNPSAGEVHHREHGKPWRIKSEEEIAAINSKAKIEHQMKRQWSLAKQVQDGLVINYDINYGVSELKTIITEGIRIKNQGNQQLTQTEIAYVQFLAAAEKYDLKQLSMLIEKFPKATSIKKNTQANANFKVKN